MSVCVYITTCVDVCMCRHASVGMSVHACIYIGIYMCVSSDYTGYVLIIDSKCAMSNLVTKYFK